MIYLTGVRCCLFTRELMDWPVVFYRTPPNDGDVGTGIPHTTHAGGNPAGNYAATPVTVADFVSYFW